VYVLVAQVIGDAAAAVAGLKHYSGLQPVMGLNLS